MSDFDGKTLLEIVNHIVHQHPNLARSVEDISQNVIYGRDSSGTGKHFGLGGLDRKLEKYLDFDNGFFVELGANDGVSQSNTLFFEKNRNWRGVLVEPTPHNYLLCLKNRAPGNHIYCNACVSDDFKDRFVEIIFSNLMSTPVGLDSDILDPMRHAEFGAQFLRHGERVFSFGAVAVTLNELLINSNAPELIDFMSLDVEGAEMEVLKGVDHNKYRFKYMLVECRDIEKVQPFLCERGYRLVELLSEHDYLFSCNS